MSRKRKRRRDGPRFRDVGLRLPDAKAIPDDTLLDLPPVAATPADSPTPADAPDPAVDRSTSPDVDGAVSATSNSAGTGDPATGTETSDASDAEVPGPPSAEPASDVTAPMSGSSGATPATAEVSADEAPAPESDDIGHDSESDHRDAAVSGAVGAYGDEVLAPESDDIGHVGASGDRDAAASGADGSHGDGSSEGDERRAVAAGATTAEESRDERGEAQGAGRSETGDAVTKATADAERDAADDEGSGATVEVSTGVAADDGSGESVEVQTAVDAAANALPEGVADDEGSGGSVEVLAGVGAAAGAPPETARAPAVQEALRTLDVPDHGPHFWRGMADELADEPQLRLRPRAAVRPITQPPPISEDSFSYDDGGWRQRRHRRRRALWVVAAILAVLAAVGAFQAVDDGRSAAQVDDATTTSTSPRSAEGAGAGDDEGGGGEGGGDGEAADDTAPPPIDPAAPLSPDGVGPLAVGLTLRDLETLGLTIAVDEPTFRGTGGTCFDATVADVGDLALRFRGPAPGQVISEPADGVLGALTIDRQRGSFRTAPEGVGLGSTADEVRAAYGDRLSEAPHPFLPAGQILTFVPDDGAPNGLAFATDRGNVTSVTAGAVDLIASPDGCPS